MRRKVDRRRWYFALFNLLLLVLALMCGGGFLWIRGQLNTLAAADQWRGEGDMAFAQIGCFLPVDGTKSAEDVIVFRRNLEQKLSEESLVPPVNGSLYVDAYSGHGKLTVRTDHGSATVQAIGVGGEFFLFHPMELRSGSYLSERDLMQDRVVLDENLAWTLFGSSDVAGMTVVINDLPFTVSGVVHREDDFASRKAFPETESALFLSYDALHALTEAGIDCYEIVLPNLISGYGMGLVEELFDVGTGDRVENSARYGLKNLLTVVAGFGVRSMRQNGVIYPYWENAVRLTEDWLALLLVLGVVLTLCPTVTLTVEMIRALVKSGKYVRKKVPETADRMIQKKREARYAKRNR